MAVSNETVIRATQAGGLWLGYSARVAVALDTTSLVVVAKAGGGGRGHQDGHEHQDRTANRFCLDCEPNLPG